MIMQGELAQYNWWAASKEFFLLLLLHNVLSRRYPDNDDYKNAHDDY